MCMVKFTQRKRRGARFPSPAGPETRKKMSEIKKGAKPRNFFFLSPRVSGCFENLLKEPEDPSAPLGTDFKKKLLKIK